MITPTSSDVFKKKSKHVWPKKQKDLSFYTYVLSLITDTTFINTSHEVGVVIFHELALSTHF